jgi:dTDP-glucose 4,6-dehydratase
LQAARDHGVAKVVHTSTSEVYGTAQFVPITEEHPLHGQSPYAASKIGADQMAQAFYCSFGTPVAIIRPFNTFGPRQSARAVLPTVILQVAGGSRTIEIGALSPTRNFNYIADTVRGFLSVAQSEYAIGEVINIGSDFEISIGEAVQVIAELMGVEVKIEVHENRLRPQRSEVTRLSADGSKAKQLTGWEPSYFGREGFKRALRETVDWFVQPENFRRYQNGQYHL